MPQEFPQPTEGSDDPARQRRPLFDRIGDEPFAVLYVRRIAIGRCCHVESTGSGRGAFGVDAVAVWLWVSARACGAWLRRCAGAVDVWLWEGLGRVAACAPARGFFA